MGKRTRSDFRGFCRSAGMEAPSVKCDFFAEFMNRMQEGAIYLDDSSIDKWARRFARGDEFQFADLDNRQILLDVMLDGPGDGTARHITKDDLKRFCSRRNK